MSDHSWAAVFYKVQVQYLVIFLVKDTNTYTKGVDLIRYVLVRTFCAYYWLAISSMILTDDGSGLGSTALEDRLLQHD